MNMDSYMYQFKSGEVEQISFSLHSLGFASFCVDLNFNRLLCDES